MKLITFDWKKGHQPNFFEAKEVKPTHWSWKLAPSEEKIHRLTMDNHNLKDFTICIFNLNILEIVRVRCYSNRWNSKTKMKTKTSICFTSRCDSYCLFAMKYAFMNAETCNENQSEVSTVFSKTYSLFSYLVRDFFFQLAWTYEIYTLTQTQFSSYLLQYISIKLTFYYTILGRLSPILLCSFK